MSGAIKVTYVGDFTKVQVRFNSVRYNFDWGQTLIIPAEHAHHFLTNSTMQFIISDPNEQPGEWTNVLVRRSGCLGDVIAAHAALSALKLKYGNLLRFTYQVALQYGYLFEGHTAYDRVISWNQHIIERAVLPIDALVNLDGVFERDHLPGGPHDSRVTRTWNALRERVPFIDADFSDLTPDFTLAIPENERQEAFRRLHVMGLDRDRRCEPMIALAGAAATGARTPDQNAVKAVVDYLTGQGFWVYLIDGSTNLWGNRKVLTVPGCTVHTTLAMMEHCDVAITPDSGSMWLAHVVPLPLVCWLGPTPAYAKVNFHPLSHMGGVIPIQMNDWINCPACFEHAIACGTTHACIKGSLDHKRFLAETIEATLSLVEKSRNGKFKRAGEVLARWVGPGHGDANPGDRDRREDDGEDRGAVQRPGLQADAQ